MAYKLQTDEEVQDGLLRRENWKALEPGLDRGYRRGRHAFERARTKPTVDNLHEWRKRAKDLWYALRLPSRSRRQSSAVSDDGTRCRRGDAGRASAGAFAGR